MKTNVYTQNLEWLKKRVKRFPYLVKINQIPPVLEPEETDIYVFAPLYNHSVMGFVDESDAKLAIRAGAEPFDLATVTKPKA